MLRVNDVFIRFEIRYAGFPPVPSIKHFNFLSVTFLQGRILMGI